MSKDIKDSGKEMRKCDLFLREEIDDNWYFCLLVISAALKK